MRIFFAEDSLWTPTSRENIGAPKAGRADTAHEVGVRAMACTSRQPVAPMGVARLARAGETRRVNAVRARPRRGAADQGSRYPASRPTNSNSRVAPPRAAADTLGGTGSVDEGDAAIDESSSAAPFDPRGNPDTVHFASLPEDTAAVCWREHMEFLFKTLDRSLGPLTPVRLPPELASASIEGKVRSETWVYTSPFVRRARFTYVDGGEKTQILNCVFYPRCAGTEDECDEPRNLGDAPLLGVDLLSLNGGKKLLVGIDLQPLSRTDDYLGRYVDSLASLRDSRFRELNLVEPSDRFYEDAQFFSPAMLFARPVPVDVAVDCAVTAANATGALQDLGAITAEDVCGVEWEASRPTCGVSLVEAKTLDAVKAYAGVWLELMDAGNDTWVKAWDASHGESLTAKAGSFSQMLANNIKSAVKGSEKAEKASEEEEAAESPKKSAKTAPDPVEPPSDDVELKTSSEKTSKASRKYARVLSPAESAAAQDFHDMWQRSHDPAIPMFAGWFGKEWAERLASEVLFPEDKAKEELKAWEAEGRNR